MHNWFTKRIHISWHIASVATGVLVGAAIAPALLGVLADIVWLGIVCGLLFVVAVSRIRALTAIALLAGLLLGAWRGAAEQQALQDYTPYYGHSVRVYGTVSEDASYGPQGDQRLRLKHIQIDGASMHGQLWVSVANKGDVKRGDVVFLGGTLSEGFGNLPASMYRARIEHIQRPHPGDVARVVRDWFADGVRVGVPEPQSALGIGYLTGQRNSLPASLDEQLRIVGLTHAVVASGYNLTILVSFARQALAGVSKYLATLSAALMIGSFMLITGLSPSMSRAGLVASLSLAAWYYGRAAHPLVLLPFAAAITVLINPSYVWGDIGWYLSFTAFSGVIIVAPLIRRYFWDKEHRASMLGQILVDTISAQLATMPIILFAFGQYAAFALPANILVLPLVPLAMLLTFISGITGLAVPGLAHWISWPAYGLLQYMTWIVERIASLPGAQGRVSFGLWALVASYILLILITFFLWRKTGYDFRERDPAPTDPGPGKKYT